MLCIALKDDGSAMQWWKFIEQLSIYLGVSTMTDGINYTGDLLGYVLDRTFDNLTDKSYTILLRYYLKNLVVLLKS